MSEHDRESPDDQEPVQGNLGEAAEASGGRKNTSPNLPPQRPLKYPLINPAVLRTRAVIPPVIAPAVFASLNPLAAQVTALARSIAPVTQGFSQQLAASLAPALPKIKLTPVLPTVDFTQYLPKVTVTIPALPPGFSAMLEGLRRQEPPNWPTDIDFDRVVEIIRDDGLPLVWVPRAEVVQEMVRAESREARVSVLLDRVPELMEDCRQVLQTVTHGDLIGQKQLAGRCVQAQEQGHHEAAQALAVAVTETAVSRAFDGNYAKVKQKVLFDPELVTYRQLRLRAALAPIHRFYTDWSPKSPHPAPEAISRHVTVHHADPSHYTPANSLVAVLLACSVLRALQELQELVEASGPDEEAA
jgi:hypothetical protein